MKKAFVFLFVLISLSASAQNFDFLTRNGVYKPMRVYDSAAVWAAIAGKEPAISSGPSFQYYWGGDKNWYLLSLQAAMNGSAATNATIASTASIGMQTNVTVNTFLQSDNFKNNSSGSSAGAGAIYVNDLNHILQFYIGSSTNGYISDGSLFKCDGNGGIKFAADGTHAPFRFSNVAIGNVPGYMNIYSDSLQHNSIPKASNMTNKTVLVWDSTGNGNFYRISKDSVGSGGGGSYLPVSNPAYTGVLSTGTLGYSPTNALATFQSSVNNFNQVIVQNSSNGSAASSDIVVNNDQSTNTTFYGDFGMNSSGFTGSGSLNTPNAVYVTSTSSDLVLGTTTSNAIKMVVNGGTTDAFAISSAGVPSGSATASAATASTLMLRDANANTRANNVILNYSTTATAAGTTTLTVGSSYDQYFTGSSTQTVVMPDATTLVVGQSYHIVNNSTGLVTVNKNGGTLIKILNPSTDITLQATDISTSAGGYMTYYSGDFLPQNTDALAFAALGSTGLKAQAVGTWFNNITATTALVDNQERYTAIYLDKAATLTGIKFFVKTQGSYTGDNENRIGLYTYSGGTVTLVASSTNSSTLWSTASANTIQSVAFSGTYAAQPGLYFVGMLYNSSAQTTAPALGSGVALSNAVQSTWDFTNSAKLYGNAAVVSSLSSSQAMTGITTSTAPIWVGLY